MKARVLVTLKREVLDPQGEAVRKGLVALGFTDVHDVRIGKLIELEIDGDRTQAKARIEDAARKLLANAVMEEFRVEWVEDASAGR